MHRFAHDSTWSRLMTGCILITRCNASVHCNNTVTIIIFCPTFWRNAIGDFREICSEQIARSKSVPPTERTYHMTLHARVVHLRLLCVSVDRSGRANNVTWQVINTLRIHLRLSTTKKTRRDSRPTSFPAFLLVQYASPVAFSSQR